MRDPEFPVWRDHPGIRIDGSGPDQAPPTYLMLNKPRGLLTTTSDERGRETVYRCLDGDDLPWLAPVGRLDKASEGLLLMSNDPEWAARIGDPESGCSKTYHVQIDALPDESIASRLMDGIEVEGQQMWARSVRVLRSGGKNAWLEIVLDQGRNRQIRRLLAASGMGVLRLVRVAIGELPLGLLGKGQWRMLTPEEARALAPPTSR